MTNIGPRSQCLIRFTSGSAGEAHSFVVPAGYVVLLKGMHVHNQGAASAAINLRLYASGGTMGLDIDAVTVNTAATHEWTGWIALNEGDAIYAAAGIAGVAFWISGAVLAGSAQFPPATRELVQLLPALPDPTPLPQ